MAEYLLLLFEDETNWVDASPAEFEAIMRAHGEFTELVPSLGGKVLGGHGLQPTTTAKTVRGDVVTDGPFIETKEAFGGYYVIDAPDLDTAIRIAKRCPAGTGGVEVRPALDTSA
jgi:hypothetical protein